MIWALVSLLTEYVMQTSCGCVLFREPYSGSVHEENTNIGNKRTYCCMRSTETFMALIGIRFFRLLHRIN